MTHIPRCDVRIWLQRGNFAKMRASFRIPSWDLPFISRILVIRLIRMTELLKAHRSQSIMQLRHPWANFVHSSFIFLREEKRGNFSIYGLCAIYCGNREQNNVSNKYDFAIASEMYFVRARYLTMNSIVFFTCARNFNDLITRSLFAYLFGIICRRLWNTNRCPASSGRHVRWHL